MGMFMVSSPESEDLKETSLVQLSRFFSPSLSYPVKKKNGNCLVPFSFAEEIRNFYFSVQMKELKSWLVSAQSTKQEEETFFDILSKNVIIDIPIFAATNRSGKNILVLLSQTKQLVSNNEFYKRNTENDCTPPPPTTITNITTTTTNTTTTPTHLKPSLVSTWETNHQVHTIVVGRSHLSLYIPHTSRDFQVNCKNVEEDFNTNTSFSSSFAMEYGKRQVSTEIPLSSRSLSSSFFGSIGNMEVDMNRGSYQSYNSTLLFGVGGDRKVYIKNFALIYQYNSHGNLTPYLLYIMTDGQLSCFLPPSLNLFCVNKYRNSATLALPPDIDTDEKKKDLKSLVSLITLMKNAQILNENQVDNIDDPQ